MENIIHRGIFNEFSFEFSWGFNFFSAGYFLYKKLYIPMADELNKLILDTFG